MSDVRVCTGECEQGVSVWIGPNEGLFLDFQPGCTVIEADGITVEMSNTHLRELVRAALDHWPEMVDDYIEDAAFAEEAKREAEAVSHG